MHGAGSDSVESDKRTTEGATRCEAIQVLRAQLAAAEQTAARIREELERAEWIRAFEGGETAK